MKQQSKNAKIAPVSKEKGLGFRSIRSKLILLGATAVLSAVILGFTGIYLINSSNDNNTVLEDVNNINLYQNENQTLEVSFLYNLDNTSNTQIVENLSKMITASADALKHGSADSEAELEAIDTDLKTTLDNMNTLVQLFGERGFTEEVGIYKDFMA